MEDPAGRHCSIQRGRPGDRELLGAADQSAESPPHLVRRHGECQIGQPAQQSPQRDSQLHPGQLGAKAVVRAVAERDVQVVLAGSRRARRGCRRPEGRGWPRPGGRTSRRPP